MKFKERTQAQKERDAIQLRRLQTLVDMAFALMIFRVFTVLPHLSDPNSERIQSTTFRVGGSGVAPGFHLAENRLSLAHL